MVRIPLRLWMCLLVLAGAALTPVAIPEGARASGPCTDVEVIGLRGSGEEYLGFEHGMGSLLGPLADTIAGQLSGSLTVSFYGVPYRAADAVKGVLTHDYFDSKDEGSGMLHDHLLERVVDCPRTKFVVMGYSQGAHAAGDLLAREGTFITDHVAALVMFGDPRFNPEASYVIGSFDSRDHGLAGARSSSDFSGWSSRVFSFCHNDDLICQGASIWFDHGTGAHEQSRYLADYGDLAAGLVRHRLGLTQLPRVPLDLAFVLDSTGSMGSSIDEVREAIGSVVDKLEEKESDFRLALVDYKDTDQGDPYASQLDLDFGTDIDTFRTAVGGLGVDGGGDEPEAVYSGLMTAFHDLSWRGSSRKAVLLMGDAPAKDPEPVTGFTLDDVLAAARALPGSASTAAATADSSSPASFSGSAAAIYPLAVGGAPLASFEPLSSGSGGQLFTASDPSQVSEQLLEAVDAAAQPVEVVLSSAVPVRPGASIRFVAGANYPGGEIGSYEWDFDGDGVPDETTSGNLVSRVFPDPYEGEVTVVAKATDGHHGSASTEIVVSEDAAIPAGPPRSMQVSSPAPNTLHISWQPPDELGGAELLGYQLLLEDAAGKASASVSVDPTGRAVDLTDLDPGPYLVSIAAVTEAGFGATVQAAGEVSGRTPASAPIVDRVAASESAARSAPPVKRCRKHLRKRRLHGRLRCVHVHRHHHARAHRHGRHKHVPPR